MGGQSSGSGTQQTQQQSKIEPWKPTQPYLNQTLSQLGPAIGNTATSPRETSALDQLISNAGIMPNFGGAAGNMASSLLGGTYNVDPTSTVGQAYGQLQGNIGGIAGGSANPYDNPAFQQYLSTITNDIQNRTNAMFAGAGRDLSGLNQEYLARGITAGTAPVFANQYNANIANKLSAANSLFGGGIATNQAGVGNATTGLGFAGATPGLYNQNADAALQAYAQKWGLPLSKLGGAESLLLPIAGLGRQASGTGTSQSSYTYTPPLYQQIAGWENAIGGFGSGVSGLGSGIGGIQSGVSGFLNPFGAARVGFF